MLTYTLGGVDAASFDIDDGTGQLMTKADLDHETKQSYTVTVTATDPGGLSAIVTVTIEVTPVNEDPVLDGEAPAEYAENGRTPVATFTASDPERATIIWTLDRSRWRERGLHDRRWRAQVQGVARLRNGPG